MLFHIHNNKLMIRRKNMRYSRMLSVQPRKKKKKTASLILLVVLLGMAVYLVGAGAAGGWLAENLINPVFNGLTETPDDQDATVAEMEPQTPSPSVTNPIAANQTRVEEQISAENITLYTLQAGAFLSDINAKAAADEIIARGGAGFVAYDGDYYRILIAGYINESDANSVKAELAAQGIATTVFKLESGALEFKIGAEQPQINAVKACFDIVPETVHLLQQIIYDTDNGINVDDKLKKLSANVQNVAAQLKKAIASKTDAMVRLTAYMDGLCNMLLEIPDGADLTGVAFSSRLKYNIINIVVDYSSFLKDLSG